MIDSILINSVLNTNLAIRNEFNELNLSNSSLAHSLSFFDDDKYLNELNSNNNIKGLFIELKNIDKIKTDKELIIVEDARWAYFTLYNFLSQKNRKYFETTIDSSSIISKNVYISDQNVKIGKNCFLYPNITILEDVEIGDNCVIQSGTVLGSEGLEYKQTKKGNITVIHDGKLIIGNNVTIGANNTFDKGFKNRFTKLGNGSKTGNNVMVSHGVQIGENTILPAAAVICGSASIGNNVWIGPNACVSSGIIISDNAFVSLGAVVTKNVEESQHVTGNFAIDHVKFLQNIKENYQ